VNPRLECVPVPTINDGRAILRSRCASPEQPDSAPNDERTVNITDDASSGTNHASMGSSPSTSHGQALRTAHAVAAAKTFLFAPADRPQVVTKAQASSVDVVVVDLEDAVLAQAKIEVRSLAVKATSSIRPTVVRVNSAEIPDGWDDLQALATCALVVMLPKANLKALDLMEEAYPHLQAIALVETAQGLSECAPMAARHSVMRLALGTLDLAVELGLDPLYPPGLQFARSAVVLASALHRLPAPIDGVTVRATDRQLVRDDAESARKMGFGAKLLIHPDQIEPARTGLSPLPADVAWARRVLDAADGAVALVRGEMIDAPVLRRARAILNEIQD